MTWSSGEITLHGKQIYVQVRQSTFTGQEIHFRRCDGRRDFTGGPNHYAPIAELCEPAALARWIAGGLGRGDPLQ